MPDVKKAAYIILLIAIPLSASARQEGAGKKSPAKQTVEKKQTLDPFQQKFLPVLDQLLGLRKGFADDNLRIMIQAQVADMLWNYDEPRARRLLEEAFQAIVAAKPAGRSAPLAYAVRNIITKAISRHDIALALKLEQSVEFPPDVDTKSPAIENSQYGERARLQYDFAFQIILRSVMAGDIEHAAQAVKPFVERGEIRRLIPLLIQIRTKDEKTANELFTQAFANVKLRQPSFDEIRGLADYLFPNFGEGVIRYSSKKGEPFKPTTISGEVIEQFIDLAYNTITQRLDAAQANTEGAGLNARSLLDYTLPKLLVPYVDRFMPDRSAAFRARLEEALRRVPAKEQPYLALGEAGVKELTAKADTLTDKQQKDALYQRAAWRANINGDFEQALAIIEKISNEIARYNQRYEMRQRMDNKRVGDAYEAFHKGDFEQALSYAEGISDWRSRLPILGSLIKSLYEQKKKERAIQVLDEAARIVANVTDGTERTQQMMALAGIAVRIDANRGFEDMKTAVGEFNRAGFVPEWEKYQETEHITEGGRVTAMAGINIGVGGLFNDRDFYWLGITDFDRAITLTQQFQMKEAMAVAQLSACLGALTTYQLTVPPKPELSGKPKQSN